MATPRRHFTHFTLAEREILRRMHYRNASCIEIAHVLGKSRISVWRELKRNTNEGEFYQLFGKVAASVSANNRSPIRYANL
jgi:IS30 family transposase